MIPKIFETCFQISSAILMEGALGERLKREYSIEFDDKVAMAGLVYNTHSREAMENTGLPYIISFMIRNYCF